MNTEVIQPTFSTVQGAPTRHAVLSNFVACLHRPQIRALEIGSFEGQSALVWSHAIAQHCERGSVMCIDPWSPSYLDGFLEQGPAYEAMANAFRSGESFNTFCRNSKLCAPNVPISFIVGTLAEAYSKYHLGKFDIVYIDGDHRAGAVRADIDLAKTLVNEGGILCGDDLERQLGDIDQEFARAHCDTHDYINNYHPGVTVAVWERFGRVWSSEGQWAVQHVEDGWHVPEL